MRTFVHEKREKTVNKDIAKSVQIAEGNVSWSSSSGDVHQKVDDILEFSLLLEKMKVTSNEQVSLDFQENASNPTNRT